MIFGKIFLSVVFCLGANAKPVHVASFFAPSNGEIIPNEYIVSLTPPHGFAGSDAEYVEEHLARVFGNQLIETNNIIHRYDLGYAAVMDADALHHLRAMHDVDFIEANQVVYATEEEIQVNPANWGLDRISKRDLPLTQEYAYSSVAGEGVDVYVIDTGINIAHQDFEGRAVWGLTAPNGDEDEDGNGHGTHVASTIAGALYGVAKKANVIAVKVLRSSGYGSMADVLKGVEWAATEHNRKANKNKEKKTKSVANMSLGGGKSLALDKAVDKAIAKGVLFAVAAGNDNRDACNYSPAGSKNAITVGSVASDDSRSYFSNYGSCVDVFAPGSDITAAWIGSKTAIKKISGTSMASPHVCGVMALLAAEGDYTASELKEKLLAQASEDKLSNVGYDSPNKMLYSNPSGDKEDAPVPEIFMVQLSRFFKF